MSWRPTAAPKSEILWTKNKQSKKHIQIEERIPWYARSLMSGVSKRSFDGIRRVCDDASRTGISSSRGKCERGTFL
jgi:hypothetical protein